MADKYKIPSFFHLLNPDNTMSFNRFLAHAIGAEETVIYFSLISKMMYYAERDMLDNDGYFFATALDIQESTTYTKRQQTAAINKLSEIGLIMTKIAGIPSKKYFKVVNDEDLLGRLTAQGAEIAQSFRKPHNRQVLQNVTPCCTSSNSIKNAEKPHNEQELQNVTPCSNKMSLLGVTKCHSLQQQNVTPWSDKMSHKSKYNKSKYNNLNNQSINPTFESAQIGFDEIDTIDFTQEEFDRETYSEIIKENISYEILLESHAADAAVISEMFSIMVDVVCSTKNTIRVNGSNMPKETVKSVFLKLNDQHNTNQFMKIVKKYTNVSELTPGILNEFIDKVYVHQKEKVNGKATQKVDIYFNGIGNVDLDLKGQKISPEISA